MKSESQGCCVIFKPKNYFQNFAFCAAHARTSQADILHLDQKATRPRPVNDFVLSFSSL